MKILFHSRTALIKIFQEYHQLIEHMEHVAQNPVNPNDRSKRMFSAAGVTEGERLAKFWKSKNAVMMVAFAIDTMAVFEKQSLAFQKNDHSIIGQAKAKSSLIRGIQELLSDPAGGPTTKAVLENSVCYDSAEARLTDQLVFDLYNLTYHDATSQTFTVAQRRHLNDTILSRNHCFNIQDFETTPFVVWTRKRQTENNVDINEQLDVYLNTDAIGKVSDFKESFLETVLGKIYEYFPEGDSSELYIFDQRLWGSSEVDFADGEMMKSQVQSAATFLGVTTSNELLSECYQLLLRLWQVEKTSCENKQTLPTHFWGTILQEDFEMASRDPEYNAISAPLRTLIQRAIVIPMGSAEAERSFSIMNHVVCFAL